MTFKNLDPVSAMLDGMMKRAEQRMPHDPELDARANLRQAINAYCTDGEHADVVLMMLRDAWVRLEPDMEDVIERAFSKLSDRMLEIERKPEPYRPDPVWGDE